MPNGGTRGLSVTDNDISRAKGNVNARILTDITNVGDKAKKINKNSGNQTEKENREITQPARKPKLKRTRYTTVALTRRSYKLRPRSSAVKAEDSARVINSPAIIAKPKKTTAQTAKPAKRRKSQSPSRTRYYYHYRKNKAASVTASENLKRPECANLPSTEADQVPNTGESVARHRRSQETTVTSKTPARKQDSESSR